MHAHDPTIMASAATMRRVVAGLLLLLGLSLAFDNCATIRNGMCVDSAGGCYLKGGYQSYCPANGNRYKFCLDHGSDDDEDCEQYKVARHKAHSRWTAGGILMAIVLGFFIWIRSIAVQYSDPELRANAIRDLQNRENLSKYNEFLCEEQKRQDEELELPSKPKSLFGTAANNTTVPTENSYSACP